MLNLGVNFFFSSSSSCIVFELHLVGSRRKEKHEWKIYIR